MEECGIHADEGVKVEIDPAYAVDAAALAQAGLRLG